MGGARSPLAAADRSIATKSVIPYLPSKYRIIVVSSMTLLLLSMVPRFGSVPFDYVQKDSGVEMRETCVGREKKVDVSARVPIEGCTVRNGGAVRCRLVRLGVNVGKQVALALLTNRKIRSRRRREGLFGSDRGLDSNEANRKK